MIRALLIFALLLAPPAGAGPWQVDRLVPGALFKGIHGLAFGPDGRIYVGSVMGQSIYRVDPESGTSEVFVGPPGGLADDIEFAPDGTMFWTGFSNGTLSAMDPDGSVRVIARGLPGLNSLALDQRGRLFATQVFAGDALWEIDPRGEREPRLVLRDLGGLNGFDFGPDGRLCGPLWFERSIVCIDVDSAAIEVVSEGFVVPAAANFDARGQLVAIDNETGGVYRIDIATHERELLARAPTNLDNLAFDAADRLYVTNMADNAIYAIENGKARAIVRSPLSLPGGIAIDGRTLYVADTFSLRAVGLEDGAVRDISRSLVDSGYPTTVAVAPAARRLASASFEGGGAQLRDLDSAGVLARWDGLAQPSAVAVLDADRIALTEIGSGGRLLLLDRRAPAAREVLAGGLEQPMGLLSDGTGWLVSESAAGRLVAIDAAGQRRTLASGLHQPEGIARLPDGRIALAETGTRRVLLVDPRDGALEVVAEDLPLGSPDLPGQPPGVFPTGIAADAEGNIYLSSDRDGGILRLRPPATERHR